MNPRRTLLLASLATPLAAVLPRALRAQEAVRVEADARPVAVTVYPDQATVSRTGTVDVPAGDSVVVIRGVPAGIQPDSVNARARGEPGLSIGSVDLRRAVEDPSEANRRAAGIRARIRDAEDAMAQVDVRIAAFAAEQALVERLSAAASAPPAGQGAASPRMADSKAGWAEARAAAREGVLEAGENLRKARLDRRPLEERLETLQAELRAAGGAPDATIQANVRRPGPQPAIAPTPRQAAAFEIAVAISSPKASSMEIAVTYQVAGASWNPVYEARLDTASGKLALRQEAAVRQTTGEDWDGVSLTLSTSRPSSGVQAPPLSPLRVTLADPNSTRTIGSSASMLNATSSFVPSAAPAPAARAQTDRAIQEAVAASATVMSSGLSVLYAIGGRSSVRADGSERRVRISDLSGDAVLGARTVPRLGERAYLEAKFRNPSDQPTLPGSVSLHLDGTFIGRAQLPLLRPGQDATLPFGADDRVKVVYEPQEARNDSSWSLAGRKVTRTSEGLAVIRNHHDRPIEITVLDQAPVAGDGDIAITVTADPQPTARDVDNRPGIVAWTGTYAPGEERRIRFGWSLTAPQGQALLGLPR